MAKLKEKKIIRVCSRYGCRKYQEDGKMKWVKPTTGTLFDFWLRGQKGERWEICFAECPACEK